MKHLKIIFRTILGLILIAFTGVPTPSLGQESTIEVLEADPMDSVEISLMTCQPHDEVYSLYGHTAIRYHDLRKDHPIDLAFNYGVFDFKKPHFVLRFVFGLTDYELGVYPYDIFLAEYRHFGSMVTEQVLNLTSEEKRILHDALAENMHPENKTYRYNYFGNNCTTKARDIIEQCIQGKLEYAEDKAQKNSYRDFVHQATDRHPWAKFGNDLLLGVKADLETNMRQQEFLPNNLMYDFDHAQIYENGQYRPLVKERRVAVPGGVQIIRQAFPLSPLSCGILLSTLGLLIFAVEWKKKRSFLLWDLLLMLTTGTIGIVLFLMLFSQHPTVSLNLQIILLNPLPWFYLWPVIKGANTKESTAKSRSNRYWRITSVLLLLFLAGRLLQVYPEGILSLALCLSLQCYIHLKRVSK